MTTRFTADLHLGHENILKYNRKVHPSLDSMHSYVTTQWNSTITENDETYVIGDMFMNDWKNTVKINEFLDILNGKIYVIPGNHDNIKMLADVSCTRTDFKILPQLVEKRFPVEEKGSKWLPLVCSHYPLASWSTVSKGIGHVHGHCHGSYQGPGRILDVGFDRGYMENDSYNGKHFWTVDEIKIYMRSKEIYSVDYH